MRLVFLPLEIIFSITYKIIFLTMQEHLHIYIVPINYCSIILTKG